MSEDLQFEKAEYGRGPETTVTKCKACDAFIGDRYYEINGQVACPKCHDALRAGHAPGGGGVRFFKALVLGTLGGLVGAAIWWAVRHFTGYEVGLIAIALGFLVGGGVRMGAEARGGALYQAMAVVLTYLAVAANYVPDVMTGLSDEGEAASMLLLPVAFIIALAAPFFEGFKNIIGILIIGFALWQAWQMNKRSQLEITGPHAIGMPSTVTPSPSMTTSTPPPLPPSVV